MAAKKKPSETAEEFLSKVALHIKQGDMDEALDALRRGLKATKSQRTTVMAQVVYKGQPVYHKGGELDGAPVMEPKDAYEVVDDTATQVLAAKIIIEQGVGYPVKKSETKNLHGFIPLDSLLTERLANSPIAQAAILDGAAKLLKDDTTRADRSNKK